MIINYKNSAFILVRAPSKVVATKKISSQQQHQTLLEEAITKGLLLYHAPTAKRGGREYAQQPWLLDKASVPKGGPTIIRQKVDLTDDGEKQGERVEHNSSSGLFCPYCERPMKTTSGRTLHVKNKHPEKFAEYKKKK